MIIQLALATSARRKHRFDLVHGKADADGITMLVKLDLAQGRFHHWSAVNW
jgi:hypothetical protein